MALVKLDAIGLRNLQPVTLEPRPGLNYVVGDNASGKTSLLEAIYLLGRARSFRTSQINQLIQFDQPELTVAGKVTPPGQCASLSIGVRVARSKREIHVGGRVAQSSAELLQAFPLLVIQPAGIALLEGAPKLRRHFLDFGVFHHDPRYLDYWRRYTKALNHRNALLRSGKARELAPWNQELTRYGIMIHEARSNYLERLAPLFHEIGGRFFTNPHFELRIQAGWDVSRPLNLILEGDISADLRYGYTQSGPHKGDFSILLNHRPVKAYVSRGQMKLLVYTLLLAQSRLMEEQAGSAGCVLIDDVASELDVPNKRILLALLQGRLTQFFITATGREIIEEGVSSDAAVFQIARGRVSQAQNP